MSDKTTANSLRWSEERPVASAGTSDPAREWGARRVTILIYSGGEIMGDGLNKLGFLRAVRRAYPDAHITWFAGNGASVYAGKLAPAVAGLLDQVIESERGAESWRQVLRPRLANQTYDIILDTQLKVRATTELKRMPHGLLVSGAAHGLLSERRAPGQPWRDARPVALAQQLLQLLALARYGYVDGPVDPSGTVDVPAACDKLALDLLPRDTPCVALAPGAGGAGKRWPLENFAALGTRLSDAGWGPVFVLGPDETWMHTELAARVPGGLFPLQQASPRALAYEPFLTMGIAAACRAAVANDAGIGHILAVTGVPMVSLFGKTDAAKFAPNNPRLTVLRAQDFGASVVAGIPVDAVWAEITGRIGLPFSPSTRQHTGVG